MPVELAILRAVLGDPRAAWSAREEHLDYQDLVVIRKRSAQEEEHADR